MKSRRSFLLIVAGMVGAMAATLMANKRRNENSRWLSARGYFVRDGIWRRGHGDPRITKEFVGDIDPPMLRELVLDWESLPWVREV